MNVPALVTPPDPTVRSPVPRFLRIPLPAIEIVPVLRLVEAPWSNVPAETVSVPLIVSRVVLPTMVRVWPVLLAVTLLNV